MSRIDANYSIREMGAVVNSAKTDKVGSKKNIDFKYKKTENDNDNISKPIDGSKISSKFRQALQIAGDNLDARKTVGEFIFGKQLKDFSDCRSEWLYELKDGTNVRYNTFTKDISIENKNGQVEFYDKNNHLVQINRPREGGKYMDKYIDKDNDGIADTKVTMRQNNSGEYTEVSREIFYNKEERAAAGDDPIKNREINSRVLYNILHDGSDGEEPVCF